MATPRFSAGCDKMFGTHVKILAQLALAYIGKLIGTHERRERVHTTKRQNEENILHHVRGNTSNNDEEDGTHRSRNSNK